MDPTLKTRMNKIIAQVDIEEVAKGLQSTMALCEETIENYKKNNLTLSVYSMEKELEKMIEILEYLSRTKTFNKVPF